MKNKQKTVSEEENDGQFSWYSLSGPYDDVILSTRVRLARNLADFLFPDRLNDDDRMSVLSLVYDSFAGNPLYHFIYTSNVPAKSRQILLDKNYLAPGKKCDAFVLGLGNCSDSFCAVNSCDHIRISNFTAGLDCERAMQNAYKIDEMLQEKLQFAASYEFGYLTSQIKDCGSGLKISFRCFIPSIVLSGELKKVSELLEKQRFCIKPVFKSHDTANFSNCLFDIYTSSSFEGTELDQMAAIQSVGMLIFKTERKIRKNFADNNPTVVLNFVKQSYARSMYAMLLDYEESVDIICAIKWGLHTGIIEGILENELNSLFYRIKSGQLEFLCDNFQFTFESDIASDMNLKIKRLRATVIQQAFEKLSFKS